MTLLAQFDVFGTPFSSKWELTARLLAQHPVQILWAAFLLLLCISACVGALAHRRFSKNKQTGQLAEPLVDELTMLRAVAASVPDLIYVKDLESRFLFANQSTARVMEAGSSSELLGKTDFDFYPRELAEGFRADELEVLRSGQPLVSRDELTREIAGKIRYTLSTKVPLRDARSEELRV